MRPFIPVRQDILCSTRDGTPITKGKNHSKIRNNVALKLNETHELKSENSSLMCHLTNIYRICLRIMGSVMTNKIKDKNVVYHLFDNIT